jgi:hypothetical protein
MQSLAVNGYTVPQVKAALLAPLRTVAFRYNLMDKTNAFVKTLLNVESATVANDTSAQIKRTAKFGIVDDGSIDFLSQRIQPWVWLKMPTSAGIGTDGSGYAKFPLGVFLLSTPPKQTDDYQIVRRAVDGYDLTQILLDDKVLTRYTITAGTNYITAIGSILSGAGITQTNLQATTLTLLADMDWAPGTAKLQIVTDLIAAFNYRFYFDENGIATAIPYLTPAQRASEFAYADDSNSVMFPQAQDQLDLFSIPNEWVLVVSEADRPAMTSTYTNSNSNNPTSTTNRGRTIVKYVKGQQAPDQATLDALAQKTAFQDSQVYETVTFETALMPMHSDYDVLTFTNSPLGISANYSEKSWEMSLVKGGHMKHVIQQVVNV